MLKKDSVKLYCKLYKQLHGKLPKNCIVESWEVKEIQQGINLLKTILGISNEKQTTDTV